MSNSNFEGKVTQSLIDIKEDIAEIKTLQLKQDVRLTNLEKWRWLLSGAIIALGVTSWPMLSQVLQKLSVDFINLV